MRAGDGAADGAAIFSVLVWSMFWRAKSPLQPDDEAWQLDCWEWLLLHFGGIDKLRSTILVLPSREFFTPLTSTGHNFALEVFAQVASFFDLDLEGIRLIAQEPSVDPHVGPHYAVKNAPVSPLGTYSATDGVSTVTYDPRLCEKPSSLIATLAHELCHAKLLRVDDPPPGDWEMEEFATDLAVTFFGFGVFNCNNASTFKAFSDASTGSQGWQFEGGGYLSPAERAFALALFLALTGRRESDVLDYLDSGPSAYFQKAHKYVASNSSLVTRFASLNRA